MANFLLNGEEVSPFKISRKPRPTQEKKTDAEGTPFCFLINSAAIIVTKAEFGLFLRE